MHPERGAMVKEQPSGGRSWMRSALMCARMRTGSEKEAKRKQKSVLRAQGAEQSYNKERGIYGTCIQIDKRRDKTC